MPELHSVTGRIFLKPPEPSDDADVSLLLPHPVTRRYLQFIPEHFSIEDARRRRESREAKDDIQDFSIYLKDGDEGKPKFVGMTGIFKIDTLHRSCEVLILVSPEFHGRGIATEALHAMLRYAFEDKGLHRVVIGTSVDSMPMKGWLEKVAGATFEGRRRDWIATGPNTYSDAVSYSILEGEWRDAVKSNLEAKLLRLVNSNSIQPAN